MRYLLIGLLALLSVIGIPACRDDNNEPSFKADTLPLNPEDSVILMKLYDGYLSDKEPGYWIMRHPDLWKGVEYEYDKVTGYRYVTHLVMSQWKGGKKVKSIPAIIGKLSHLRSLEWYGFEYEDNFTLPEAIFDCPLETLKIDLGQHFLDLKDLRPYGLVGKLPSEIRKVKSTLRYLWIMHTNLSELCDELGELTNLEVCMLKNNRLTGKVPDYFGDMKGEIDVSYNLYTEYNWYQLLEGKNIPTAFMNYIHNDIPAEVMDIYNTEPILRKFAAQNPGQP